MFNQGSPREGRGDDQPVRQVRLPRRRGLVSLVVAALAGATTVVPFLSGPAVAADSPNCAVKPSAATTGATGTLTSSTATTVATAGTTVQNTSYSGDLMVSAAGVSLTNVAVNGTLRVYADGAKLQRVTAKSVVISGAKNLDLRGLNVSGAGTAVRISTDRGPSLPAQDISIRDSFIHDPSPDAVTGYSATQLRGATRVTLQCNTYQVGSYGNAAIYAENVNGGTRDLNVTDNWLDGGGFTFYSAASNVTMTRNVFGRAGKWGICRNTSGLPIVQSGNSYLDGAPAYPCSTAPATPTTSAPTSSSPTTTSSSPSATQSGAAGGTGSCVKPSAVNTGVYGTRTVSPVTALYAGQTLENVNVAKLDIRGSGVTVRNVSVAGGILIQGDNVLVDHVTAKGVTISSAENVTVQYANIGFGSQDGFQISSDRVKRVRNILLTNNYVHDPVYQDGTHYDGTQVRGADGLRIFCSVYDAGPFHTLFNAGLYLEHANGGTTNVRVENNWYYGHAFSFMIDATNTTIVGNRLGGDIKWGPCYLGRNSGSPGFVSDANTWDATGLGVTLCGMTATVRS